MIALLSAAALLASSAGGAGAMAASGSAARTLNLNDKGRLRLTSHHGFTLNEVGTATGTIRGPLYIHLRIVSTNRVTAEVSVYPRNGSLTGYARASYHTAGATASFNGTLTVLRGSGAYAHAHGSGLSFSGTIARSNDAVTVRVSGRLSL
jgi:hypothetical protein